MSIKSKDNKQETFDYHLAINTNIKKTNGGNYDYINDTNKFKSRFKKNPFVSDSISFFSGNGKISFYTSDSQIFGHLNSNNPEVKDNTITYPNIFEKVDLRYTISSKRLLEEFIVRDANTAAKLIKIKQFANTNSKYSQNDDGSISFTIENNEKFKIPKPVMYELGNKDNKSYGIKYEISRSITGELVISKVLTDEGLTWLKDNSRIYPIAIDLVIDNANTSIDWISNDPINTVVSQETSIKHGGTGSVKVQTTAGTFPGEVDYTEFSSDQAARAPETTEAISATGGTITYLGGYTIHTFTGSGTFTVNSGSGDVEVLVVAGGGGGGSDMGGGGGGGGVIYDSSYTVAPSAITVTVGSGGAGAPAGVSQVRGSNGGNSVFGTLTAIGGGGGASEYGNNNSPASSGGSGGGAASCNSTTGGAGTSGQGYAGGNSGGCYYPGGGGGAGGPGGNKPGDGGPGLPFNINGKFLYYGGGGGGAGYSNIAGNGGVGGGGGGAPKVLVTGGGIGGGQAINSGSDGTVGTLVSQTNVPGGNGGANTGGGGGGGSHYNSNNYGGSGGSGVVIVRYPTAGYPKSGYVSDASGINATGGIISYSNGYKIHTFKQSDSFNILSGSGDVEVLVVAGGGGGGSDMGGGGGGGGVIYDSSYTVGVGKMPVTIGLGGSGAPAGVSQVRGSNGGNSVFGTLTAIGGGGGASEYGNNNSPASSGGSGGGTASCNSIGPGSGIAGQGYSGGGNGGCYYPGGGGGAGGAGGYNPGDGGIGFLSSINGTAIYYGGGGGGAGYSLRAGNGGLGGGGGGAPLVSGGGYGGGSALSKGKNAVAGTLVSQTNVPGGNGGANTGGGGGGGSHYNSNNYGGSGGSGVVIVRYPIPALEAFSGDSIDATGGSISTVNGNTIHMFTSSGTFTVNSGSERAKVMVVGGGGGGGSDMGGGGGAGGYIYNATYPLTAGSYFVNIGAGGNGAAAGVSQLRGANGGNTVFDILTAFGGGGGASEYSNNNSPANSGGSGGGSASSSNLYGADGIVGQGYSGGDSGGSYYPGGGGGAGGPGSTNPGNGGAGILNDITGTSLYWAGGGAGAGYSNIAGNGGIGGGGGGAPKVSGGGYGGGSALNSGADGTVGTLVSQTNVPGGNGGANTGGGGGGGSHYNSNNYGGSGGSGIVVISYPTPNIETNVEGSYSLKAFALASTSLDKTLTRTIATPLDLSTSESVTFNIMSSRTGSNIKVGLHDSGGTTTELTPNITNANTFQSALMDLTDVTASNKDSIDKIVITIVNADEDNTFYIDNMENVIPSSYEDTVSITKTATDLSNTSILNFWVRSSVTGSFASFQFGESDASEQSYNFNIEEADTWEQKTWDLSEIPSEARDAVTKFAFRFVSDTSGAIFYFDDITTNPPNIPALDSPTDTATDQDVFSTLKTTAIDDGDHYLRYKIKLCTNSEMTTACQTFDQTSSQVGWSGQDIESGTAYTSGTQASYTIQSSLQPSTTYYWQSWAIDPGGANIWSSTQVSPFSFTTSASPSAPTNPYTEGEVNPVGVIDLTPEFSATNNDSDGDNAISYQIEVNTLQNFSGATMWDSGKQSMTAVANGSRSQDISYDGSTLSLNGLTYYWRIRFWDQFDLISPWSATQNFTMNIEPNAPTLDEPSNGATQQLFTITFRTTATDVDDDYLRYKIQLCTNLAMNFECQTFDQTSSQVGWSGQNIENSTAYTSNTQAAYTTQASLTPDTTYYWRSWAIDPAGKNYWSATQTTPNSFTTMATPLPASSCFIKESPNNDQLTINWTDNANNEDYYEVQKSVDGGEWTVLQTALPANTNNVIDNNISNGHNYQYRIAPYFAIGPYYASWCIASSLSIDLGLFNLEGLNMSGLNVN